MNNKLNIAQLLFYLLAVYFFLTIFGNIFYLLKGVNGVVLLLMLIVFLLKTHTYGKEYQEILLIILFIFSFQSIYILKGQLNFLDSDSIILQSKYMVALLVFPVIYYLIENKYLSKIVNVLSKIFFIKFVVMTIMILDLNFINLYRGEIITFLYENTNIKPYTPIENYTRVFDSFAPFFPLILFYMKDKRKIDKILIHLSLMIYLFYVGSIGIWLTYLIIITLLYFKYVVPIYITFLIILFYMYYDMVFDFLKIKEVSISIKLAQIQYTLSSLKLFGEGLGYEFIIDDRRGFLIENLFLYIMKIYGVLGFLVYMIIFVLYPIYILIINKSNQYILFIGLTYLSIVISSASNPYLMSGISMVIFTILLSFEIYKNQQKRKKL